MTAPNQRTPEKRTVVLRGEHITLAQALKAVGIASTGGQAKYLVREGDCTVNDLPEKQPGRKLRANDRFRFLGEEWTVVGDT